MLLVRCVNCIDSPHTSPVSMAKISSISGCARHEKEDQPGLGFASEIYGLLDPGLAGLSIRPARKFFFGGNIVHDLRDSGLKAQ